jgi:7,8-dihydropterin-6-yl-methyl-4-(beta-D-ribofuranosyl)aminobenzene 5'-phosphate synthase
LLRGNPSLPPRSTSFPFGTSLACECGLSLHLESHRAVAKHSASHWRIILRNADLLDIYPAKIDGLILSHAHRDHFGGLIGFVM